MIISIFQEEATTVLFEMFSDCKPLVGQLLSEGKEANDIILNEDTVPLLLKTLRSQVIDDSEDTSLKIHRSCLWQKAQTFYKKGITDYFFSGENGVDGGALRNEFFVAALKSMNIDYFEGNSDKKLPRSHWGCEAEQVVAGVLVDHSLLLGGPGFPCLHPAVYDLCVGVSDSYEPNICDIPMNAVTEDLLDMITKVSLIKIIADYYSYFC